MDKHLHNCASKMGFGRGETLQNIFQSGISKIVINTRNYNNARKDLDTAQVLYYDIVSDKRLQDAMRVLIRFHAMRNCEKPIALVIDGKVDTTRVLKLHGQYKNARVVQTASQFLFIMETKINREDKYSCILYRGLGNLCLHAFHCRTHCVVYGQYRQPCVLDCLH